MFAPFSVYSAPPPLPVNFAHGSWMLVHSIVIGMAEA